ncbi:hypothetical protein RD110_18535 [Rhodoferax koreense]|uniref:Uncharacterized protein n=1 Tax=Rhodoferax koreensis TaxID=1842727 RepID=A0A1P8JYX9_9BURK|nr:glycosyl hydrolase 108 family protein [Rhodoferax koreense]APW38954.1 hypothetical protein RD110_18535 [Rhodoferax koreense]
MNFDTFVNNIIAVEKGYVDHPDDKGGPTNYGITLAVARANGYQGDMRDLPVDLARKIYGARYISEPKFDQVAGINMEIAMELIDTGVNMGPGKAAEFLQRWLNGFNDTGSRYADLFVDGRLGPVSLAALQAFLRWRGMEGIKVMLKALNGVQAARYLEITEGNRSQRAFLYGWINQRVA